LDGQVLLDQRRLAVGGPAQAAGVRARPLELRLRRPPPDVPTLRAVAAVRESRRRLPLVRLERGPGENPESGGPLRSEDAREAADRRIDGSARVSHTRIRKFNTQDTYPEQRLDNDLCQAVVAGDTVYLRGQVGQNIDTAESVGIGDVAAQTEQAM